MGPSNVIDGAWFGPGTRTIRICQHEPRRSQCVGRFGLIGHGEEQTASSVHSLVRCLSGERGFEPPPPKGPEPKPGTVCQFRHARNIKQPMLWLIGIDRGGTRPRRGERVRLVVALQQWAEALDREQISYVHEH